MLKKSYKQTPIAYEINYSWRENGHFFRNGLIDFIDFIKKDVRKVVEVGSFLGDSTILFAQNFDIVYSIDPYIQNYDLDDAASYLFDMFDVECNFIRRTSGFQNIIKMKMTGEQAANYFIDDSLDLVYIDDNHQYETTKKELISWLIKVKKGGFISGHDYNNSSHPGVKLAVDEILGDVDRTFCDYSWIKKIV